MKTIYLSTLLYFCLSCMLSAQHSISNPIAANILTGVYEPSDYLLEPGSTDLAAFEENLNGLLPKVKESQYLSNSKALVNDSAEDLQTWLYAQFSELSAKSDNRLQAFYFGESHEDGQRIAGAVMPGRYNLTNDFVIVEASAAQHAALGTATVMEIAALMSETDFDTNIVFLATSDDEDNALNYHAFVKHMQQKGKSVRARFNYDIIKDWDDKFSSIFMGYRGCR